jgi:hypothetical protein
MFTILIDRAVIVRETCEADKIRLFLVIFAILLINIREEAELWLAYRWPC